MLRVLLRYMLAVIAAAFLSACSPSVDDDARSSGSAAGTSNSPALPECQLVMGWDPWQPYQYMDASGEVTGLDISAARAVAAEAGCTLALEQDSWMNLLRGIESGEIDLVAGATRTPAREDNAWFTTPYRTESFVLYMRAEDEKACAETDSLRELVEAGKRIGTVADYYYGDVVADLQADPAVADRIVDATVGEVNVNQLLDGRIDAFIEDPFVATATLRARGLGDRVVECPMALRSGDVSFMLSRAGVDDETFQRVEDSLLALKRDGRMEALVNRYREVDGGSAGGK